MGDQPDYEHGQPKPVQNSGPSMHDLVASDLIERKQYGLQKYESLLQAYNGRNFLQDIYEEMQDGIVYIKGALEEQKVVIRLVKFLLDRQAKCVDSDQPVLTVEGQLPGWLLQTIEEALGDKFVYNPEPNDRYSERSQRPQVWDYLSQG